MTNGSSTRAQNRQQLRAQEKLEAQLRAMQKANPRMYQLIYQKGWDDGARLASSFTTKDCYAAALLAMRKIAGYGQQRGIKLMREMDAMIVNHLYTEALIDEVFREMGIKINFNEAFSEERIAEDDGPCDENGGAS